MVMQKFCASGNDFLITHFLNKKDFKNLAKKLCDRHYGFGADGFIVLIPSEQADFEWLFYNSDGTKADMCGNGARATALYAYKNKIADKKMSFVTGAGIVKAEVFPKNIVQTELTKPKILSDKMISEYGFDWFFVNTGVPHLCAFVDNLDKFDLETASKLRHKYNSNVNLFTIKNGLLYVRTFERGVENETLACGTGMCACAFFANKIGMLKTDVITVIPKSLESVEVLISDGFIYFRGVVTVVGSCLQFD